MMQTSSYRNKQPRSGPSCSIIIALSNNTWTFFRVIEISPEMITQVTRFRKFWIRKFKFRECRFTFVNVNLNPLRVTARKFATQGTELG
jgi:hypothetical protein